MKQRRFRIIPTRDYHIEILDGKDKLITSIIDSGFCNKQQMLKVAANKCQGSHWKPKYVYISCQETNEWGMYNMQGKKLL